MLHWDIKNALEERIKRWRAPKIDMKLEVKHANERHAMNKSMGKMRIGG